MTLTADTNLGLRPRGPSSREIDGHFREALAIVEPRITRAGGRISLTDRQVVMLLSAPAAVKPEPSEARRQALMLVALKADQPDHPAWLALVNHLHPQS